jgi:hypothetical protein
MLSALMTTPPSSLASRVASADLPDAVGPAIRMAFGLLVRPEISTSAAKLSQAVVPAA